MLGNVLFLLIKPFDNLAQRYVNKMVKVYGDTLQLSMPSGVHGSLQVLQDFHYAYCGVVFTIKKGSLTDGSSVPFWARWVCRWNKILVSGAAHDQLYRHGLLPNKQKISKLRADWIYFILSQYGGDRDERANIIQAVILYLGLALGGWFTWFSYRFGGKPSQS